MAKGLRALALLDKAQNNRETARLLRARAGMYSTEYDWVLDMYDAADKADREAKRLENRIME